MVKYGVIRTTRFVTMNATMAQQNPFINETSFYNRIVLSFLLPPQLWEPLPHFCQTWLRHYLVSFLLYFIMCFLWCFYIYYLKLNVYVPKESIPSKKAMMLQVYVAMKALPLYTLVPCVSEYMIERGWTRCYSQLDEFNWFLCALYIFLYLVSVEIGIYWFHKKLHDIKFLYKHIHSVHHIYNKQNTLSPFAGHAIHPLDGMIMALPHTLSMFIVPIHLTTHLALVYLEGFYTVCIHDNIHACIWPIMGAGYHTIHHTTYKHNYGHYTIWLDWFFGTLKAPEDDDGDNKKAK